MKVGDLVKFNSNGMIGLLLYEVSLPKNAIEILWKVSWSDGTRSQRWQDELEIINESR